ncbi:hypothetical protein HC031_25815 [Planosporangium thailandense]|uniref:Uncharacterized protein n=1 Tax=Planosporangium thailandense TaxID=765197 RepID=A0ABX0Y430_9ACTN|nr:hypothetical protein [Planosporangium thailandense]NJC73108.1 hypothetical protein [Planosporangium thailandense]
MTRPTSLVPPTTPSAAAVHAVVAAGLADPDRLRAWRDRPDLLAALGLAPATVDLEALEDFAGLSEKIRYNQCRGDLPLTFRLLSLTQLEIDLFRQYAPQSLARRQLGRVSTSERLDGLLLFVEAWTSDTDPVRCLVRDVLRHEHTIASLRSAPVASRVEVSRDLVVPRHNGRLVIHRMTCDPRQVGTVLRDRHPDLTQIRRGRWTFGYHRSTAGPLRILEMEPGIGDLLMTIDGRRSFDQIAADLFGDAGASDMLHAAFAQLTRLGLLVWDAPEGVAS